MINLVVEFLAWWSVEIFCFDSGNRHCVLAAQRKARQCSCRCLDNSIGFLFGLYHLHLTLCHPIRSCPKRKPVIVGNQYEKFSSPGRKKSIVRKSYQKKNRFNAANRE